MECAWRLSCMRCARLGVQAGGILQLHVCQAVRSRANSQLKQSVACPVSVRWQHLRHQMPSSCRRSASSPSTTRQRYQRPSAMRASCRADRHTVRVRVVSCQAAQAASCTGALACGAAPVAAMRAAHESAHRRLCARMWTRAVRASSACQTYYHSQDAAATAWSTNTTSRVLLSRPLLTRVPRCLPKEAAVCGAASSCSRFMVQPPAACSMALCQMTCLVTAAFN